MSTDLLQHFASHLDNHLFLRLIDHALRISPNIELSNQKLQILSKTFLLEPYKLALEAGNCSLKEWEEKKHRQMELYENFERDCSELIESLNNGGLSVDDSTTAGSLDKLSLYAKFLYECGKYNESLGILMPLCKIMKGEYLVKCLWGILACQILLGSQEGASFTFESLRNEIDKAVSSQQTISNRAWLLHWSLFIFSENQTAKNDLFVDLCIQPPFMNVLQCCCPHLLRYVIAFGMIHKKRRGLYKDLIKLIIQESSNYSDPITQCFDAMAMHFEFDRAQVKLKESFQIFQNDLFLAPFLNEFKEISRQSIFDNICRIYSRIDLPELYSKLDLDLVNGESVIASLSKQGRVEVTIKDNRLSTLSSHTNAQSQYQEKLKIFSTKACWQLTQLEKLVA